MTKLSHLICLVFLLALSIGSIWPSAARVADAEPAVTADDSDRMSEEVDLEWLTSFNSYENNVAVLAGVLPSETETGGQRRKAPSGQIGTYCVALPRCPDCVNGGNVCLGAEQFYPGLTYFLGAKKDMVSRCKRANALDYCGGSYGCVRQKNWTPREGDKHRQRYGGGCARQCERVVSCAFQGR